MEHNKTNLPNQNNAGTQIYQSIQDISNEYHISPNTIMRKLELALVTSYQKKHRNSRERLFVDCTEDGLFMYAQKTVVLKVQNPNTEISMENAKRLELDAPALGNQIKVPIFLDNFDRVAAHLAKDLMHQSLKKQNLYNEFQVSGYQCGQIVYGTVVEVDAKGNLYVQLTPHTPRLPLFYAIVHVDLQVPSEQFQVGDPISGEIVGKRKQNYRNCDCFVICRNSTDYVQKLLADFVPEIADGKIEVYKIARFPGYQTKIVISPREKMKHPVRVCIGVECNRLQEMRKEMKGEAISIIQYQDDYSAYVKELFSPVTVTQVEVDSQTGTVVVYVPLLYLNLAHGMEGKNTKLVSQLLGQKVVVKKAAT